MTTSSAPVRPPYDVIAVFDSDGDEPPFAYTVGVFEAYGGPELFAWGRPDEGLDPGERWHLSMNDLHAQLTRAVDRLRAPEGLSLGDSWATPLDGGRSSLVATVVESDGEPSYEVPPGTPVQRLHLTLLRPPPGRHVPLSPDAWQSLRSRVERWREAFGSAAAAPLDEQDVFGPGSAGVRLVLDHLAALDDDALWAVSVLDSAGHHGSLSLGAEAAAVARTAGRGAWLEAALLEVGRLVEEQLQQLEPADRDVLRCAVLTAYRAAVTAWVLADLIDDELFRRGTATLRAFEQVEHVLECDEPVEAAAASRARTTLAALQAGWRPQLNDDDALLGPRARWVLACSGRGGALASIASGARVPRSITVQDALDAVAAALVLDLDGELSALLPPTAVR